MSKEKEGIEVMAHWEEIERLGVFCTSHLKLRAGGEELGYYRIWHSPETDNIAFYGPNETHGVMPPMEYQAKPDGFEMIKRITDDIEKMGYVFSADQDTITDYMLIGSRPFLNGQKSFY